MAQSKQYDFSAVQKKWNERWDGMKLALAEDFSKKPKMYNLVELPYPSGAGLHMGHCWNYTLFDAYSRMYRMKGYNVLYPMGWDSFGLPAYNYAVKVGRAPQDVLQENIATFKRQLKELGLSIDWTREINTASPEYYKWTQWIFEQMYEHWYDRNFKRADGGMGQARPIADLPIPDEIKSNGKLAIKEYQDSFRLAYKAKMPVYWCDKCKTGLANEEVTADNLHERCETPVEQRDLEQWLLRITSYGDRLDDDLDTVDFPYGVKVSQRDWIGRSEGIEITYDVVDNDKKLVCYTTTPVNFGASFIVISPEHKGLMNFVKDEYKAEVEEYVAAANRKNEYDRVGAKEKSGVFTGSYAINHVTGEEMPVWVADFVLATVGTGVVQGCPGHDQRDWEFATKYDIDIPRVVVGENGDEGPVDSPEKIVSRGMKGTMINSDFLNGMDFAAAMQKTMDYFEEKGWGKRVKVFRFHDWVFSRQHYWGEPTPMIHCDKCGWNTVPIKDLPVELPRLDDYKMGEDGSSPLESADEWKKTTCPECYGEAVRETDVMPNWAGSNWYFLRYLDPHNSEKLIDKNITDYWMQIDTYYGGQEHVTLHLLYSRFVYKFLYDLGIVSQPEPYKRRRNHGIILGPDNRKMSKSWGNVINPDSVISEYGADVVRMYVMFIGPYDTVTPWSDAGIAGVSRFAKRVCSMMDSALEEKGEGDVKGLAELVSKIEADVIEIKFNTVISSLMEFTNKNLKVKWTNKNIEIFLRAFAPFAPYMAEEYWEKFGFEGSVHMQGWPEMSSEDKVKIIEIPVMINGKVRGRITVGISESEDKVVNVAMEVEEIKKHLPDGHDKVIYVPGKALSFVKKG